VDIGKILLRNEPEKDQVKRKGREKRSGRKVRKNLGTDGPNRGERGEEVIRIDGEQTWGENEKLNGTPKKMCLGQ